MHTNMSIRPYCPSDKASCLEVFQSNVPQFFLPYEAESFAEYLDEMQGGFWVVVELDVVVACGGYEIDAQEGEGWICWVMVRPSHHRRGLGRLLVLTGLQAMAEVVPVVRVDTHQHSRGFFERMAFVLEEETTDGYGPGLDCYELSMTLDPESNAAVNQALVECGVAWERRLGHDGAGSGSAAASVACESTGRGEPSPGAIRLPDVEGRAGSSPARVPSCRGN
jgi:GNAT superfamily N-acetyltransferase